MPNRIIREGLIDSDRINKLTPDGERFYVRLMLLADDFGRYDGREQIVLSRMFPLKADSAYDRTYILECMVECEQAGLIKRYKVDNKPYMEIQNFRQRTRAQKSKYPDISGSVECPAVVGQRRTETDTESETDTKKVVPTRRSQPPKSESVEQYHNRIALWIDDVIEQKAQWQKAFPAINFEGELARAAQWLKTNPSRRKKLLDAFLNRWCSKAQETGRITTGVNTPPPLEEIK